MLRAMKTVVSIPDDLFALAGQCAEELGMSRSQFYAAAVRAFISAQQRCNLTERINAACAELDTALPEDLANAARKTLLDAEW